MQRRPSHIDPLINAVLEKVLEYLRDNFKLDLTRQAVGRLPVRQLPPGVGPGGGSGDVTHEELEELRTELNDALDAHAQLVASVSVLGHVRIDGTTITIDSDGRLHATPTIPPPPDTYDYVTYEGDYVTFNGQYVYIQH